MAFLLVSLLVFRLLILQSFSRLQSLSDLHLTRERDKGWRRTLAFLKALITSALSLLQDLVPGAPWMWGISKLESLADSCWQRRFHTIDIWCRQLYVSGTKGMVLGTLYSWCGLYSHRQHELGIISYFTNEKTETQIS